MSELVEITVELTHDQALAFAQFLKRVGYCDYRELANTHNGDSEVYEMIYAGEEIRRALAEEGYSPR